MITADGQDLCSAIHSGFFLHAASRPDACALMCDGREISYGALARISRRVTRAIEQCLKVEAHCSWVTIWCGKSEWAYGSIMGILLAGRGFLPLAASTPPARVAECIERAGSNIIVVDEATQASLADLLAHVTGDLIVIVSGDHNDPGPAAQGSNASRHRLLFAANDESQSAISSVRRDKPAYLMFTSGSTGRPKGVVVSHGNVRAFLDDVIRSYDFSSSDRFTQFFDFSFDLSIFDIFVSFEVGARLCPMQFEDRVFANRFIRRNGITVWFSVPSFVSTMLGSRQLAAGGLPSLRYSFFCGEAITYGRARAWQRAAPQSVVENLYGPTEATISCTRYRLTCGGSGAPVSQADDAEVVPIGRPHRLTECIVVDVDGRYGCGDKIGELLIGGPQVSLGYLDDPVEQNLRFTRIDGRDGVFYHTGDLVRCDEDNGTLHFIGRMDHQVKIKGYRVELGEVEVAVRKLFPDRHVVALAITRDVGWADLVAVVEGAGNVDFVARAKSELRLFLPEYMVPNEIMFESAFPLNTNGKIDRNALRSLIEARTAR